jgi:hypothetical protein
MKRSVIIPSPAGRILCMPDGTQLPTRAWTGGDWPAVISRRLRSARTAFFRVQVGDWRRFWGDFPDKPTRALFFKRATADAHRTLNP